MHRSAALHRLTGRVVPFVAASVLTGIVALATVAAGAAPARAETVDQPDPTDGAAVIGSQAVPDDDRQRVPCEVALVVGCVTTAQGSDGPVTVTLQTGTAAEATTGEDDTTSGDEDESAAAVTEPEVAPPVRSGVDPWERGGLRSNFGTAGVPISHYQIGADTAGFMGVPDPLDSFVGSQTNWAFTTSTFLVLLSTNTLDWAFEFPLADSLIGRAGLLAQEYTIEFFGFGLSTSIYALALMVTMVVAGFKAVTRGLITAGSEVALAFVAYVVLIVLTMTSAFGDAGLYVARLSSDLSSSIASFAAGEERQAECAAAIAASEPAPSVAGATASTADPDQALPAAAQSTACSFGFALQRSLVELPYQNLQWGQVLDGVDGKERCAQINQELLAEGPWGNADEPRERMGEADECRENADFNGQATYIRLGIASANALAAAIVTLLVMVVAAMLLWQQLKLLFLTAVLPHTLVFAILPGRSRMLAWRWLEHLIGVVIRTVILALGLVVWLSLFSLIVYEQLTIRGIFLSLFASTTMAIAGFYSIYKLSGMARRAQPLVAAAGRTVDRADGSGDGSDDDRRPGPKRGTRSMTGGSIGGSSRRTVQPRRTTTVLATDPSPGPSREPVGAGR